jgi:hypothetical protein
VDKKELMSMPAEKAIEECSWESIEFLFKPTTVFELLLRSDLTGMCKIIHDGVSNCDDPPISIEEYDIISDAIDIEKFYRELKEAKDGKENTRNSS